MTEKKIVPATAKTAEVADASPPDSSPVPPPNGQMAAKGEVAPASTDIGAGQDAAQAKGTGRTLAQRRRDPDAIRRAFESGEYPGTKSLRDSLRRVGALRQGR